MPTKDQTPYRSRGNYILVLLAGWLVMACMCVSGGVPIATGPSSPVPIPPRNGQDQIAFVSDRDGNLEIYVMNADGSGLTNLSNSPAADFYPAWSPDGNRLAWVSRGSAASDIYILESDGSFTNLTNNPGGYWEPAWSPDGTQIAFSYQPDAFGNKPYLDGVLHVVDVDGTNLTELELGGDLEWSPDGQWIAFQYSVHVAVITPSGDDFRAVTIANEGAGYGEPAWSPDGNQLAMTYLDILGGDETFDIYVVNFDGDDLTALTSESSSSANLDWSPDGSQIAFALGSGADHHIWVMSSDGSNRSRLTTSTSGGNWPKWSPDGEHIAFFYYRGEEQSICIMKSDGSDAACFGYDAVSFDAWTEGFAIRGPAWRP
jgi:TolB protein